MTARSDASRSNDERQAAFRKTHLQEGECERLARVVSAQAKRQWERLARHCGVIEVTMGYTNELPPEDMTTYNESGAIGC